MAKYVKGKSYISKDKSYKFKVTKVSNGYVWIEADDGNFKVELSDLELLNPTEIKESVDSDKLNKALSQAFRVNGPAYRGARMPSPIPSCVNVCNFDDKLRPKYYDVEYKYSGDSVIIDIEWITQEDFKDADKFVKEVTRWARVIKGQFKFLEDKKIVVQGTITCRDGKEYGFQKFKENV